MDWSDKYLAELKKTILLKNNCLELREEFDEYQSERLAIICKKYLPKYRNNSRDIPSKKASYKINALKIQYEILQLSQWLAYKSRKMEHEKKKRLKILKEVALLRKNISSLKVNISTTTKGIPFTVIEVREAKNEAPNPAETTVKDVVVQYSTQQEMEKVLALQAEQISDASKVLGVVKIKHNY